MFNVFLLYISSILVVAFWLFGWSNMAMCVYIVVALIFCIREGRILFKMNRGISYADGAEALMASASMHMSKSKWRPMLGACAFVVGAGATWPFRVLLGTIGGYAVGALFSKKAGRTLDESGRQASFFMPPSLLILLAFACQGWFMLVGFDTEFQKTWFFKTVVACQLAALIIFLVQFNIRKKFEKNFSDTAMRPFVFFVLSLFALLAAAVLNRQVFEVAFNGYSNRPGFEVSFQVFQLIIENSGIFDVWENVRSAESLEDLGATFSSFISSVGFSRAVDILLGFSFVSQFGRSVLTMMSFSRDDSDHLARCRNYLQLHKFERVRQEMKEIESREAAASIGIHLALVENDIPAFEFEAAQLGRGHVIRIFGDDKSVQHYLALQEHVMLVPLSLKELFQTVDSFADAHGRRAVQAAIMLSYLVMSKPDFDQLLESSKHSASADSLLAFLTLLEEVLLSETDVIARVDESFPIDKNIARLALGLSSVGAVVATTDRADRNVVLKHTETLLSAARAHLEDLDGVSDLYLAIAMQAGHIQQLYKSGIGQPNDTLEEIISLWKGAMRDRGYVVPSEITKLIATDVN